MKLIWWLFYRKKQPSYKLWLVDREYKMEQEWEKRCRREEIIGWIVTIIVVTMIVWFAIIELKQKVLLTIPAEGGD